MDKYTKDVHGLRLSSDKQDLFVSFSKIETNIFNEVI